MGINTILAGTDNIEGVTFRVALIPEGNPNRPGYKLNGGIFVKSTIHETANTDAGANAEMHRRFVSEGQGGLDHVSFHAVVDDHEIIQLLPFDEVAWHAGDGAQGPGNRTSVATETCVNSDGDWLKTLQNLAVWQRFLLELGGLKPQDVVQHNHWSGKDCPHYMRLTHAARWSNLIAAIDGAPPPPQPDPSPFTRYFPTTGHSIAHAFKDEWEKMEKRGLAMRLIGYPITEEREETIGTWTGTVQYFERARFEWHTESGLGVVLYGLIGDEDAQSRGIAL